MANLNGPAVENDLLNPPTILELDFYESFDKKKVIRYGWNPHEQYFDKQDYTEICFKYEFNDSGWNDISNADEVELNVQDGLNEFKIYAYDKFGNKSDINTIKKIVDELVLEPPQITGPFGFGPDKLHQELWKLVQGDLNKSNDGNELNISYSFLNEGVKVFSEFESSKSRNNNSVTTTFETTHVSTIEFVEEIEKAFNDWKDIIESAFPSIKINFLNTGFETKNLNNIPSANHIGFTKDFKKENNIADIRIGIVNKIPQKEEDVIPNIIEDVNLGCNDIHLNAEFSWKLDSDVTSDSYSIRFAMRHLIGKSLGLNNNNVDSHGTMHRITKGKTIRNTKSSDYSHFYKTYSYPFLMDKKIRVSSSKSITFTWESDTDLLYEWCFKLLDTSGKIFKSADWTLYEQVPLKFGEQLINLDEYTENNLDTIRFYVRSVNLNGNKSLPNHQDVKIVKNPTEINLISINEKCETNPMFKANNKCSDKFGMYSAELTIGASDCDKILVEIYNLNKSFKRYELITEIKNRKFKINSLESNSNYGFKVANVIDGIDLKEKSNQDIFSIVGTRISDFSESKTFKTSDSYLNDKTPIEFKFVNDYFDFNENEENFISPMGESVISNVWKPCAIIEWEEYMFSDFLHYEIQYSSSSIDNKIIKPKSIIINDITNTIYKLRFDEYNKKYYIRLIVRDIHGNISKSIIATYKTVLQNTAPTLSSNMKVTTSGENTIEYEERPEKKWTLEFEFPIIIDKDFPAKNKIPDIEDFSRDDYSLKDWENFIGHPPISFICYEAGKTDKVFELWMTKNKILDQNFKETDYFWSINNKTKKPYIRISEFSAELEYIFEYKVYDTTGHYIEKKLNYTTLPIPLTNYEVPSKPELEISLGKYLNGYTMSKESLVDHQWNLDFKIQVKNQNFLDKFVLYSKLQNETHFSSRFLDASLLSHKKINSETSSYHFSLNGFLPKTHYQFKVDAVNFDGKLSTQSETVDVITPLKENKRPDPPQIYDFKRSRINDEDKFLFKVISPSEKNLTLLVYYTNNIMSNNFWEYEQKTILSNDEVYLDYSFASSTELKNETHYKVAFIWRDSAYNYSFPTWRITELGASTDVNELVLDNFSPENLLKDDYVKMIPAL